MKATKFLAGLLLVTLLLTSAPVTEAAPKKKTTKPPQPITVEADELYFSDKTGELFAKGNVVITQDLSKIYTELMRGNDKETEIWTDNVTRLQEPLSDVTGMKIRYNYGLKFGTMQDIKGKCGDDFITGKKIHFEDGKYTAYEASTTGCKTQGQPDYRVTARKVVIWPNDKMIAYDAKVWVKNMVIYATPRYKRSLKKTDNDNEFPSLGYQDPDGYWINQRLSYALTDNISAYTDLTYYTVAGFKPTFGLVDQEKNYTMRVVQGDFRDANSNWVRKSPEFRFDLYPQTVGKLPWSYTFSAVVGNWTDTVKTSWHQDYTLYFTRQPIYFDKKKTWTWTNGFGLEEVLESYNNTSQNMIRYNTAVSKAVNPWLAVWTGFNYTGNNNSAFTYNKPEVSSEWVNGIFVKLNPKIGFSYVNSFDLYYGRTYENYYTAYFNLHCWDTYVQYQEKKARWIWNVTVVRF